jgi:hypothetical protein
VSQDNFLLMTPLLFEVFSGTLDVRHASFRIPAILQSTWFDEDSDDVAYPEVQHPLHNCS